MSFFVVVVCLFVVVFFGEGGLENSSVNLCSFVTKLSCSSTLFNEKYIF